MGATNSYAIGFSSSFDHSSSFQESVRDRFFYIDMSSLLDGINENERVPVVGSCDNNDFRAFLLKEFTIISICFGGITG